PFTSWTTDPAVALNYALRPEGGGAVLEAVIPLSRTVASPNLKIISLIQGGGAVSEAEVLVRGVVTGAKGAKVPWARIWTAFSVLLSQPSTMAFSMPK